jgi:hypothetical protein
LSVGDGEGTPTCKTNQTSRSSGFGACSGRAYRRRASSALGSSFAGNLTDRDVRLWRLVATAATTLRIALPSALFFSATSPYAVVAASGCTPP